MLQSQLITYVKRAPDSNDNSGYSTLKFLIMILMKAGFLLLSLCGVKGLKNSAPLFMSHKAQNCHTTFCDGLAPSRWQAILWASDDSVHWRLNVIFIVLPNSLGLKLSVCSWYDKKFIILSYLILCTVPPCLNILTTVMKLVKDFVVVLQIVNHSQTLLWWHVEPTMLMYKWLITIVH